MKIEFNSINGTSNVQRFRKSTILRYPCSSLDYCDPYKVTFAKGAYKIELWGASSNAKGGYTKGNIYFNNEETFYFHIGASKGLYNSAPPYAVTIYGSKGGGATDMRFLSGLSYNFDSLKTRIMVAAGSGSWEWYNGTGMNAGGLVGEAGNTTFVSSGGELIMRISSGANQTSGGPLSKDRYIQGSFGLAGYSTVTTNWGATGGGGYYGGTSIDIDSSAGGGSSFISGYKGCDAIFENSTENNIFHSHQPIHYSQFVFFNMEMKGGKEKMPLPTGGYEIGHEGHGIAKITPLFIVDDLKTCGKMRNRISLCVFIMHIIS